MQSDVTVIDHPLIASLLSRLRDTATGPGEFRSLLNDIARLMTFEVTRDLDSEPLAIETPLGPTIGSQLARPVVLVPILRAGLGMLNGFVDALPDARVGHIGMARDEETHQPESYYCKLPADIGGTDTILIDPMLATGNSSAAAAAELKSQGATRIRFVSIVSCPEGIGHFSETHPDIPIFTAAIDEGLDENAYIVPGLGDAGDRYFGTC